MPNVTGGTGKPVGLTDGTNPYDDKDTLRFGKWLAGRIQEWASGANSNFHRANLAVAYAHSYGLDVENRGANAAAVSRSGEQGTVAEVRVPHAASLARKVWNVVVGPEFVWSTVATNTNYANESQALVGRQYLEYYWYDKGCGDKGKSRVMRGLQFSEGYLHTPWDEDAGDIIGEDAHGFVHQGDISCELVDTWDVMRDPSAKSFEALPQVIVRCWRNKYDLAAKLRPVDNSSEALEDCQRLKAACVAAGADYDYWAPFVIRPDDTDLVPVYYLWHRRTASVPQGRQTRFLQSGDVLSDEPLNRAYWEENGGLPLIRYAPDEYAGLPYGYTKYWGILGIGQGADALSRDLLTNATSVASNIISAVENADFPVTELGGGIKLLPRAKEDPEPKAISLHSPLPQHFKLKDDFRVEQQQLMGIDSLTAGNEIGANLSGAAMTVLTTSSVKNNSQEQAKWADFATAWGRNVLAQIDEFMTEPRKVLMAGKSRASLVQEVTMSSQQVKGVKLARVSLGSAMSQTEAGVLTMVEMAADRGWIQTPQDVQTVFDTRRLDAMTEDISNEMLYIKEENEALGRGEDVPVMLEDNHILHIQKHRGITNSLIARRTPGVPEAVMAHLNEHFMALTDPKNAMALQLLGQQPAPTQPPAPGATSGTPPPKPGATSPAGQEGNPAPKAAPPPLNAATGEAQPPGEPQVPALATLQGVM